MFLSREPITIMYILLEGNYNHINAIILPTSYSVLPKIKYYLYFIYIPPIIIALRGCYIYYIDL